MAAAVPLVTRVGGVADVVSDAEARLVESEHVAALARASPDVLTNPGQAMARAAAARARLGRAWALTPWLQQRGRSYGAAVEWYA